MSSDSFQPARFLGAAHCLYRLQESVRVPHIDPTYAIAEELGIEVDWRPFTLDIPSYLGSARLSQEGKVVENERTPGQWTKVKYAYHDVRRYGSLRGLVIRGATKMWDSSLAGIGMLWAKEQGGAVLRAYSGLVFERFWKRELNLEDAGVIERVLERPARGRRASRITRPARVVLSTTAFSARPSTRESSECRRM